MSQDTEIQLTPRNLFIIYDALRAYKKHLRNLICPGGSHLDETLNGADGLISEISNEVDRCLLLPEEVRKETEWLITRVKNRSRCI